MEYYSATESTDICNYIDESQKCFVACKKPDTKEFILYVCYMILSTQNYRVGKLLYDYRNWKEVAWDK